MKECFLTSDRVHDKKKLCEIACQEGNDSSTCKSTSELKDLFEGVPVFMRPGAPCNNFQVSAASWYSLVASLLPLIFDMAPRVMVVRGVDAVLKN